MQSILFVGRRNAARSIMAEACFNVLGVPRWRAFSAGWQTQAAIDRHTLAVLRQAGLATDNLSSKPVAIFRQVGGPRIDFCVFMDEVLPDDVGDYPAAREVWAVADPSLIRIGAAPAGRVAYQRALGEIRANILRLIGSGRLLALQKKVA